MFAKKLVMPIDTDIKVCISNNQNLNHGEILVEKRTKSKSNLFLSNLQHECKKKINVNFCTRGESKTHIADISYDSRWFQKAYFFTNKCILNSSGQYKNTKKNQSCSELFIT